MAHASVLVGVAVAVRFAVPLSYSSQAGSTLTLPEAPSRAVSLDYAVLLVKLLIRFYARSTLPITGLRRPLPGPRP